MDELREKQQLMRQHLRTKKVRISSHDAKTSFIEGVFARGDRRLGQALLLAWQRGCKMDGWSEYFDFDKWVQAIADCGLDPAFYANRRRPYDEVLPWDHLYFGVDKAFLIRENKKAHADTATPHCRLQCLSLIHI